MPIRLSSRFRFLSVSLAVVAIGLVSCADPKAPPCPSGMATVSVLVSGLHAPTKLAVTPAGGLLVAEAGVGPNTGRVSLIDAAGGRRTLVDGLPSGLDPFGDPSGPSGIELRASTLFLCIGEADTFTVDPVLGDVPNPEPSSPLLSSLLAIELERDFERDGSAFVLRLDQQHEIAAGGDVLLADGAGHGARVRRLADFPNVTPDPAVGLRASNPFGLAVDGRFVYVADASLNRVQRIDSTTGAQETLVAFPSLPNPLPFGPPRIDTVPDGIRVTRDGVLVTLLTGFPFPIGGAEVRSVEAATGSSSTLVDGLTMAIDVLSCRPGDANGPLFVLEFSTEPLADGPGRLLRLDSPGAAPVTVAEGLISPTGVVLGRDGDLFVTEIFTGRVLRLHLGG